MCPPLQDSIASDLELPLLLEGLKQRGIDPYVFSDIAPVGADIMEDLWLAVERADRVLVVLDDESALNPIAATLLPRTCRSADLGAAHPG
jgi:hypothetical protein